MGFFGIAQIGGGIWNLDGQQVDVTADTRMLIFSLDDQGQAAWARVAGGDCSDQDLYDDLPRQVIHDPASDKLYITGDYTGPASFDTITLSGICSSRSLFIAAYDDQGDALWAKSAAGDLYAEAMVLGSDGLLHLFGVVYEFVGFPKVRPVRGEVVHLLLWSYCSQKSSSTSTKLKSSLKRLW